jgi:hypothetical protein
MVNPPVNGLKTVEQVVENPPQSPSILRLVSGQAKVRVCTEFIEGTNGTVVDVILDLPFMLRISKHS